MLLRLLTGSALFLLVSGLGFTFLPPGLDYSIGAFAMLAYSAIAFYPSRP